MKYLRIIAVFALAAFLAACGKTGEQAAASSSRPQPTALTFSQTDETTVVLNWEDKADGTVGYRVYLRTEATGFHAPPLNIDSPLPATARTYTYTGLEGGKEYAFGVQALGATAQEHSQVAYTPQYKMLTPADAAAIEGEHIAAPADLTVTATSADALSVSWKASPDAVEYLVYMRPAEAASFGAPKLRTTETSCSITGLSADVYVIGVQARASHMAKSSAVTVAEPFRLQDPAKVPVINSWTSTYAYVLVNYTMRGGAIPEYGLCFSDSGIPTVADTHIWGPTLPSNKTASQLIPNAAMEYGKEYQVCAYQRNGTEYFYSAPVTVSLKEEPELPSFDWKKVTNPAGVPDGVEVYSTVGTNNGRPFKAWYAVADCSKDVELRVLGVKPLQTIDKISESYGGDCYVMINGGYFDWGSDWSSPYVTDGTRVGEGYGSSRTSDASWTLTTPGVIGVDKDGNAGAYWWSARPSKAYYYTLPLPTYPDGAKYWYEKNDTQLSSFPCEDQKWEPYNAISAGPMVLYNGRVVVDHSHNGDWYTTNYELIASDIFPGYNPDRTAIGVREDGKIVLFVCDGRVDESDGASLPELGLIMKSIGCVAAQNLDGGGSTGMMLGNQHLNTWDQGKGTSRKKEYRAVRTALGFFKRR